MNHQIRLLPQENQKPQTLQLRAYKHVRHLEMDPFLINQFKARRRYLKTFPAAKLKPSNNFERLYSFALSKKQKKYKLLEPDSNKIMYFTAKLLRTKHVLKLSYPHVYADKKFLRGFSASSSVQRKISHLGMVLRNEKQDLDRTLLFQLHKAKILGSIHLFCFGSANPFKDQAMSYDLNLKNLISFRMTFVWMGKTLLANTTRILSGNPQLRDINITAVDWKLNDKDKDFEAFLSVVSGMKNLTSFRLSNILLNSTHESLFFDALSQLKNLKHLGLGLSVFPFSQYPALKHLFAELSNLKTLNLEFDSLELSPQLFEYISQLEHLKEFHIKASFNESFTPCLIPLASFFKHHPFLEKYSFLAFETPGLEEESFNQLLHFISWCPNLNFLDLRVRKFAEKRLNTSAFENLSQTFLSLPNLRDLSLNLHVWYPVKYDLGNVAKSLSSLTALKTLSLHFPLIKEKCTETLLTFCRNITNLKQLRVLTIESCLDEPVDLETEVFNYLLDQLPKLKDISLWYHDLARTNNGAITPYNHLEKKAIDKYQLSNFILANILIYTYSLSSEEK